MLALVHACNGKVLPKRAHQMEPRHYGAQMPSFNKKSESKQIVRFGDFRNTLQAYGL
jgi:hypothetical protein